MERRTKLRGLAACVLVLCLGANLAAQSISVVDFRGKTVTLKKPALRIACVLDSSLTIFHMLGIKDEIVAVHFWTKQTGNPAYPFHLKIDPRIGTDAIPAVTGNVEATLATRPDLIIEWAQETIIPDLEKSGIPVYGVQIDRFSDVAKLVTDLGALSGKAARAKEIVGYMTKEQQALDKAVKSIAKPKSGLFVWGPSLLDLAGLPSTGDAILKAAGLSDVAAGVNQEHFTGNMETVLTWNPEFVVLWNTDKLSVDGLLKDPAWSNVKAVAGKQVLMIPNLFYTDLWTPKYLYAVHALIAAAYPGISLGQDFASPQTMLKILYGKDLTQ